MIHLPCLLLRQDGGAHFFDDDDDDGDDDHGDDDHGDDEHGENESELANVLAPRSDVSLASELERVLEVSGAVLEVSWDLVLAQVSHRLGAVSESWWVHGSVRR